MSKKEEKTKKGGALLDQLVNHAKKATRSGKKASSRKPAEADDTLDLDVSAESETSEKKSKRSSKAKAPAKAEKPAKASKKSEKAAKAEKPSRASKAKATKAEKPARSARSAKAAKGDAPKANLKASSSIGELITGTRSKAGKYNGTDINAIQATFAAAVNSKLGQIASPKSIAQAFADVAKDTFDVKLTASHFEEASTAVNAGLIKSAQVASKKKMADLKAILASKGSVAEVVVLKAAASVL